MVVIENGVGRLSVILAGHPNLRNALRRPTMEDIGYRTDIGSPVRTLRIDPGAIGERGKGLPAQVGADGAQGRPDGRRSDFDHDVQELVAAQVTGEIAAFLDFSFGQRARVKHAEGVAGAAQCILLPAVAVITDAVDRAGLLEQQPGQGFHAIAIDQNHPCQAMVAGFGSVMFQPPKGKDAFGVRSFPPHPQRRGYLEQI